MNPGYLGGCRGPCESMLQLSRQPVPPKDHTALRPAAVVATDAPREHRLDMVAVVAEAEVIEIGILVGVRRSKAPK